MVCDVAALPGAAGRRKPALLQTFPKRHSGAIENDPEVGRSDGKFLTDLVAVELHDLAHHEHARRVGWELFEAEIHDVKKLLARQLGLGIAPIGRRILPVTGVVEKGVEVVDLTLLIEGRDRRPATFFADGEGKSGW